MYLVQFSVCLKIIFLVTSPLLIVADEAREDLHATRTLPDHNLIVTLLVVVLVVITTQPRLHRGWAQNGPEWFLLLPLLQVGHLCNETLNGLSLSWT